VFFAFIQNLQQHLRRAGRHLRRCQHARKYWSGFLIAGLVLASLVDSRRSKYLRSTAPWVTVIAGFALLGPHLVWLSQYDFELFEYAIATHVAHSLAGTTGKALFYLAGCAAYVAAPVLFVLLAARPYRAAIGAETERYWHQVTPEPLRYVGCRGAEAVAAYAADRPRALPLRSFSVDLIEVMPADAYDWPQPTEGWSTRLARTGMALVCVDGEMDWLGGATARAARNPESRRVEIELARNFLGISGAPQRYVIFIIPPAR
jgi:hypothetical protein